MLQSPQLCSPAVSERAPHMWHSSKSVRSLGSGRLMYEHSTAECTMTGDRVKSQIWSQRTGIMLLIPRVIDTGTNHLNWGMGLALCYLALGSAALFTALEWGTNFRICLSGGGCIWSVRCACWWWTIRFHCSVIYNYGPVPWGASCTPFSQGQRSSHTWMTLYSTFKVWSCMFMSTLTFFRMIKYRTDHTWPSCIYWVIFPT